MKIKHIDSFILVAIQILCLQECKEAYKEAVGAWFYSVIPGQESRCWNMLHEKYFDMFVTDRYDKSVENELYELFIDTMKAG